MERSAELLGEAVAVVATVRRASALAWGEFSTCCVSAAIREERAWIRMCSCERKE